MEENRVLGFHGHVDCKRRDGRLVTRSRRKEEDVKEGMGLDEQSLKLKGALGGKRREKKGSQREIGCATDRKRKKGRTEKDGGGGDVGEGVSWRGRKRVLARERSGVLEEVYERESSARGMW